jgi:hypothetical protein
VFDIDEHFPLPKAASDLIPGDNLSVLGDQQDEKFEGLSLQLEPPSFAAELKFAGMKAEFAELIDGKRHPFPSRNGWSIASGEITRHVTP